MNKTILRNIIYGVIIFILLAIQSSNIIAIKGVFPDFLLILVVLHSIKYGDFKAEIFGFVLGILLDAMSGTMFGINAFVFTFIAWFTHFYRKYIQVSDLMAFIVYIVIATLIKYVLYAIFHLIFQAASFFEGYFFLRLLGEIAYNGVFAVLFFFAAPLLYPKEESQI